MKIYNEHHKAQIVTISFAALFTPFEDLTKSQRASIKQVKHATLLITVVQLFIFVLGIVFVLRVTFVLCINFVHLVAGVLTRHGGHYSSNQSIHVVLYKIFDNRVSHPWLL
jgi:hypothetical protein